MNLRSDDDSWDLGSSVGVTAVMVAAARARETEAADPLICDPYARILVVGADPGGGRNYSTRTVISPPTMCMPFM